MAARNFGELRAEFKDLLDRKTCTDALADQFLNDALTRLHRILDVPGMEREICVAFDSDKTLPVPSELIRLIDFDSKDRTEFKYLPPDEFRRVSRGSQVPPVPVKYYTRRFCRYEFYPEFDIVETPQINILCYSDSPSIEDDADYIPILVWAPDLVKYAAMADATAYFEDADRAQLFERRYLTLLAEIQDQSREQEMMALNASMNLITDPDLRY